MYVTSSKSKGKVSNDQKKSRLFNDNNCAHTIPWNSGNSIRFLPD